MGISPQTTLIQFLQNMSEFRLGAFQVIDLGGNVVTSANMYVGTGFKVQLLNGSIVTNELKLIVRGDMNGDGLAD